MDELFTMLICTVAAICVSALIFLLANAVAYSVTMAIMDKWLAH